MASVVSVAGDYLLGVFIETAKESDDLIPIRNVHIRLMQ